MNKTQGITFGSIVAVGIAVSLGILLNRKKEDALVDPGSTAPPMATDNSASAPAPASLPAAEKAPPKPASSEAPPTNPEGSAEALVKALVTQVAKKDVPGFLTVAGETAVSPEVRGALEKLIQDPSLIPDPQMPAMELAKTVGGNRWLLKLKAKEGDITREIHADLTKEDGVWKVAKIQVPSLPTPTVSGQLAVQPPATDLDALTVAHLFSAAAEKLDFESAARFADPGKVSDERLAALLIAMEEGGYKLVPQRPLIATLSKEDISWVLARLASKDGSSEFALELGKDPQKGWLVRGLTFDKMLAALADKEGSGTAYTPIVDDLKGGESIVLFFEYDNTRVTPRTLRQLDIIAKILKQDHTRKIHINGHADAKGSDDYNEALSDKRAFAVKEALESLGVAESQVVTQSYGESRPIRPNFNPDGSDNPQGRSKNRRAEVRLDF